MSHDIEADYQEEHANEERRCPHCKSYLVGYCEELEQNVLETAHCDFFSSQD